MSILTSLSLNIKKVLPSLRKTKKGPLGECIKKVTNFTLPYFLTQIPLFSYTLRNMGAPHTGYHGTSLGALGKRQATAMKFDHLGKRLYFADPETAKSYAMRASQKDGTEPVILYIGSHDEFETNHPDNDLNKGYYDYFPNPTKVHIYSIFRLNAGI